MMKMSTTLMLLAITTGAFAAPPVQPPATLATANDGYVLVKRSPFRDTVKNTSMHVCPVGYFSDNQYCGSKLNWNGAVDPETGVMPITPQQALDKWFGDGKTVFVGISPGTGDRDIIFYRILQK
jgi:hypothetical protein